MDPSAPAAHGRRRRRAPSGPLLLGLSSLLASRCDGAFAGGHREARRLQSGDDIDTELDCGMRRLFLEMAQQAVPWRRSARDIFDALELGSRCGDVYEEDDSSKSDGSSSHKRKVADELHTVYVCPHMGNDEYSGNATHPFGTIHRAVEATRALARTTESSGVSVHKSIVLHPGIHFLEETLVLEPPLDSNLTIRAESMGPEGAPTAWISGGFLIDSQTTDWKRWHADEKIWVADLSSVVRGAVEDMTGLFTINPHRRLTQARYPNADVEVWDAPDRYVAAITGNATDEYEWLFPEPSSPPEFYSIDLTQPNNPTGYLKNDSSMEYYNWYGTGRGGTCAQVWGNEPSYWCGNVSAGGWAEVDRLAAAAGRPNIPVGLAIHNQSLRERFGRWDGERAKGAVFHVQHSQGWAWHMFNLSHIDGSSDESKLTVHFDEGGSQGGRNFQCVDGTGQLTDCNGEDKRLRSGMWYVEGVLEELDAEEEFYYDARERRLYLLPNATWCHEDASSVATAGRRRRTEHNASSHCIPDLIATNLKTLIKLQGRMDDPLIGVQLQGIGFRDAAKTSMEQWGVPSGGDWALHRGGAVHLEGTENVKVSDCHFTRLDGNAIMLSSYNRHAHVARSEFSWIGNGAMATWGDTENGYDATGGAQPRYSIVENNIVSNIGLYQKQSSAWGQNKACRNTIRNNVIFSVPRAAINFNDGLGGGNLVQANIIWNTCRESGDHGAINSWDRMPFLIDSDNGPSFTPLPTHTSGNLIMANYDAAQGFDNDDGSSWYYTHDNVFYSAFGFKMDYGGHSSSFERNLVCGGECYGTGDFLNSELADKFVSNTCILDPGDSAKQIFGHIFQCSLDGMNPSNNAYFSKEGNGTFICGDEHRTLEEMQADGYELGSTLLKTPEAETIIAWARDILGQPAQKWHKDNADEEKKENESALIAWIVCSIAICGFVAWTLYYRSEIDWIGIRRHICCWRTPSDGTSTEPLLETTEQSARIV